MAFPFPFLTPVFASFGGEGLLVGLLSFVRNQPAAPPVAGFSLGGARTGFPDFSRGFAHSRGILALFRASGRAGALLAETPKP
jgi:hypothetical protein